MVSPSPAPAPARPGPWWSLRIVALISLLAQLALCQFFSFGARVPVSIDTDPSNLWKYAYQWPPQGEFLVVNWLGFANLPAPLNPFSAAATLPAWLFFTTYAPVVATLALGAMAAFLRELGLARPAALFGAVVYAWQGDLLPFVFPGHYGYIATWPFYALAAWGSLRAQRAGGWPYALISGACCGTMVGLQPDRGAIASLLVAAFYLAAAVRAPKAWRTPIVHLAVCAGVALAISLAAFLALFQSFIVGVSMGAPGDRAETYKFATQFCLGPEETLTYLAPGIYGWHSDNVDGPYWGRTGQWPDWPAKHEGTRNLNLAISTIGTIPSLLALLGGVLILPGRLGRWIEAGARDERLLFFSRLLLAAGALSLVLAWGYHTPLYRLVYALPLMDKWRNPLKWLEIFNFAAIALSAVGLHGLLGWLRASGGASAVALRRTRRVWLGSFVVLALALGWSFFFEPSLQTRLQADGYDARLLPAIVHTLHLALGMAALMAAALWVLCWLAARPHLLSTWHLENRLLNHAWKTATRPQNLPGTFALILAALSALQLGWVTSHFIQSTELGLLTAGDPLVERLRAEGNTVRASLAAEDPTLNFLLQNQLNTRSTSCLEISAASRVPDALSAFLENFHDDVARLWLLAGVKFRVVPQASFAAVQSDPKLKANTQRVDGYTLGPSLDPSLPTHALVEFRDYLPKATFVPGAEILATDQAVLARLRAPAWNPRATLLLAKAPSSAAVTKEDAHPVVSSEIPELIRYTGHEIEINVNASRPGCVLINDAYDPDWRATVNDRPAPVLRADYLLRAVPVPGGASSIHLRYVAHYHLGPLALPVVATNLFCDAAMLLAWIVAGVALWRRPLGRAALQEGVV